MHWWEWVFSGIGVLGLGLLIEWMRRRSRSSPQSVSITAQGAKVTDSPVASGTGIVQTVNSPTVNLNVGAATQPALPELKVEIRQVCLDEVLESLTQDWSDYTFELYVFVYLWVVNTTSVPTTMKERTLTLSGDGKTRAGGEVSDFSGWHQQIKWKERNPNLGFEGYVIKDARKTLTPFPSQPFQHGIPSEGWICFKVFGVTEAMNKNAKIELCIVDSFGQEHRVESPAPLLCKGDMVNPELPF